MNSGEQVINTFKARYPNCFSNDSSSAIKGYPVKMHLKPNVVPVFRKPYSLPYKMIEKVDAKLYQLLAEEKLVKVDFSEWPSPIFAIPKRDNDVRICVDLKKDNSCLQVPTYAFPRCDDIFNTLNGGKVFCALDLTEAYTLLKVDPAPQFFLTINTHRGLYRFTRLCYGVSSAPALFQQFMDTLLHDIPKTCYLDDVLCQGKDFVECGRIVEQVLKRLNHHNVRINSLKCKWFSTQVEYLGHVISEKGRSPAPTLTEAILKAPAPSNQKQLRSFLGLLNFTVH